MSFNTVRVWIENAYFRSYLDAFDGQVSPVQTDPQEKNFCARNITLEGNMFYSILSRASHALLQWGAIYNTTIATLK